LIGKREPFSFVDPSPIIDAFGSVESFRAYVDEGRAAEDANLVPASPATRFDETPRLPGATGGESRPLPPVAPGF
jgi:hypothetical protein